MSRSCCCGLVVVLIAAVAAAQELPIGQRPRTEVPLRTQVSNPRYRADFGDHVVHGFGEVRNLRSSRVADGASQDVATLLSDRAPDGYAGPAEVQSVGALVNCPGAVPEGEPICSDGYEDSYNGGCNSDLPAFRPIACGARVLGTSGTFLRVGVPYRDTDWYQITVTTGTEFTFSVVADFDVLIFLIQPGP